MMVVMGSLTGQLLLSNASLFDPNFRRTVVLVGHHDEEGAVGVVLNRPFDVTVDEAVPPLAELVRDRGSALFQGGPVQPEAAVVVADFEDPSEAGVVAFDSIGFLPEEGDRVDARRRSGEPVCSPGTRDGGRGSSKRSSTRKRGSSRQPGARTSSTTSPSACGRRCWPGWVRASPSCARCRSTRRRTDGASPDLLAGNAREGEVE